MAGSSLIPDSIKDTFGDLLATYQQIEGLKLQKRLADAQLSLASAALPSAYQDAQAKAGSIAYEPGAVSPALVIGLGLAAAVAVYLIVK